MCKSIQALRVPIAQYHPENVFNMNEITFFKYTPRWLYVLNAAPVLKQDKSRATVVVAANVNGAEMLPLLFLGKTAKPHWILRKPDGVDYYGAFKGRMTVPVFQKWFRDLDNEMKEADRQILLLLDNAPVHIDPQEPPSSVRLMKLPPNTIATTQPMNQGVIASLKREFMDLKTDTAVDHLLDGFEEPHSIPLIEAMQ